MSFYTNKNYRYKPKGLPNFPVCEHNTNAFQCRTLRMRDAKKFHDIFYSSNIKTEQDVLILKYTKFGSVKRHRPKNEKNACKKFHTKYYIPFYQDDETLNLVQVCQATFLGIIQVSRSRVETVIRNFMRNIESPKGNRGGLRENRKVAYISKEETVIKFIQTLTVQESHYCRSKTSVRKYLPGDLNIRKLHLLYNTQAETDKKIKKTFFYKIFNSKFNLGFGRPATDACSTCIEFKSRIKHEKDPEKKATLEAQKQLHRKRKKCFF